MQGGKVPSLLLFNALVITGEVGVVLLRVDATIVDDVVHATYRQFTRLGPLDWCTKQDSTVATQ